MGAHELEHCVRGSVESESWTLSPGSLDCRVGRQHDWRCEDVLGRTWWHRYDTVYVPGRGDCCLKGPGIVCGAVPLRAELLNVKERARGSLIDRTVVA